MCWVRRKTPAFFPDCTGKATGECENNDPVEDHIQWCEAAVQRGTDCDPATPTTQTSSTRRKVNCPRHRENKKGNGGNQPGGGSGSSGEASGGVSAGSEVSVH
ncbi:hypothetical protein ASPZODRAFT_137242 [Penicilliopsis zonata CBS 506.65]|uniref:Uncharacterized protein n=1 Tax=Penicilliopsis zonata CBS 506.65 TaxID=1073090 RepID=A0A1L9S5J0_9EURO|nr:hypothetical protein ASPZODRAFT_137242 [Penicilliopsis zonata CBS 506.65]OJJ42429.1 hypothetical protein ASPZODRAFT_137242 [Penicilliopsis zonata CBS 506.65]